MLITINNRCFPHVVNLAVQAVLSSITHTNSELENNNNTERLARRQSRDAIAILRTLINKV